MIQIFDPQDIHIFTPFMVSVSFNCLLQLIPLIILLECGLEPAVGLSGSCTSLNMGEGSGCGVHCPRDAYYELVGHGPNMSWVRCMVWSKSGTPH